MKAKTAQDVPIYIIEALYDWIALEDRVYLRGLIAEDDLIRIHIIGGGMQIRNFLRGYPNDLDLDCHWLDNNWMAITERMLDMYPDE